MPNKQGVNVEQTTTGTGTGDLTLEAPATGRRAFSAVASLKPSGSQTGTEFVPYYIESEDGTEWEFGMAEINDDSANGELNRTGQDFTIFESSNSGSAVNFSAGTKTVRLVTPPDWSSLDRHCSLECTAANFFADFNAKSWIEWTTENADTDSMFDPLDPTFVYVPLWANKIEVFFRSQVRTDRGVTPTAPPHIDIDADEQFIGFDSFGNFYHPMVMVDQDATNFYWYCTFSAIFHINGDYSSGNPIDYWERPWLRIRPWCDEALTAVSSSHDVVLIVRVIA